VTTTQRPTAAFVGASWAALLIGASAYLFGLWNAQMQLNEKGYYLTLLLYGLFAAISLKRLNYVRQHQITFVKCELCWSHFD
jgi:uncharacterized membrane protein YiaA